METRKPKGVWVRSSSTPERKERLKAHHEFEASDLKRMLDNDWEIREVKCKRQRIQKSKTPKEVIVSVFGGKLKMTFTDYQLRGKGLTVLMEIF